MNIVLWIFQVLLALHTAMGAAWKLSNSEQTVPSLAAIPHVIWMALSPLELLCCVGLILPAFRKRFGVLAPIAASVIAAEMLMYIGVHLTSGDPGHVQLAYWAVVAAFCAFLAFGRFKLKPIA